MNLADTQPSRGRGDSGSGMVAGLTFMFAFTFLALVWLANDVDRGVSNQTAAQSIAFQAARAGAQSADLDSLRVGDVTTLDVAKAESAARDVAAKLFTSYGVAGSVTSIVVDPSDAKVTVTVSIVDGSIIATGTGSARPQRST